MTVLTQQRVRRMLLAAQGLWGNGPKKPAKNAVLETIRRMGFLQIDTISVVARSPYLVLWTRLGEYEPKWLDELLAEGEVFEYWAHAACFIPREDYGIYRRRMIEPESRRWAHHNRWLAEHRDEAEAMLAHIRANGPVQSADFARPDGEKGGGWWSWKTEKLLLEILFTGGELMIADRKAFQRIYDLRERVRPDWDDAWTPPKEDAEQAIILRAVRGLGVARPEWVCWYGTLYASRAATTRRMLAMVEAGTLARVEVEGWKEPGFVAPDRLDDLLRLSKWNGAATTLLSPFDPVVFDRGRALELFGFDYKIECYTPERKRKYGYFTLPILHGDRLVGRLDPKAHRREGVFEVKALHLEPGVELTDELLDGLADTLKRCAAWHRTPEVVVRRSDPPEASALVTARL